MMFLRSLVVGLLATNCYILADEDSNQAAVIDPGGGYQDIIKILEERGLTLRYIILTHNHPDHTAVVQRLKEIKGSEILMHRADEGLARMMPSFFDSEDYPIDGVLEDGDEISLGHLTLRVIHTPGHTPGSICLLLDTVLFSGDTLFRGSVGRTDLPGGSWEDLRHSLREKLALLPDEVRVYPGHGPETSIGYERKNNPYWQM